MQTTSGHLSNNGGLRGHSAGEIFPWRVLITGTFDSLKYWIIAPNGKQCNTPYDTAKNAYGMAGVFKELEEMENSGAAACIASAQ